MPVRILHIKTDELQEQIKGIHGVKNAAVYVYKQGCRDCKDFKTVFHAVRDEMANQPIDFYKVRFHAHKGTVKKFMEEHGINRPPAVILYKKTGELPTVLRTASQLASIRSAIKRAYDPTKYDRKRASETDPLEQNFHERVMKGLHTTNQINYGREDGDSFRDVGVMLATTVDNGSGFTKMDEVHDKPTVLLMYRPGCTHCVDYLPKYREVANGAPGHVRVLQINMKQHGENVVRYMDDNKKIWQPLKGVPTVYMVRPGRGRVKPKVVRVSRSDMTSDRLLLKMDEFFKDFNSPNYGLNPASVRQDNGIVCRQGSMFGNGKTSYCNLEDAVAGNAIVMFHSPTCPACKRAMPLMDKLANELQNAADKFKKDGKDVTEVKVLSVDHPNNLKRVSDFIRRYNDIVLLGGRGRAHTIQIPHYPSVYIFRKDQPYTAISVKPSSNPNAPDKLRFISLDLLRYAVNTIFPGCGLKSITDTHRYDPLNLKTYDQLSLAAGGDDLVSLFSVKGSDDLEGGEGAISMFSVGPQTIRGGEEKGSEEVSLFSDVTMKGGEEVSLFSDVTMKGGEEVSLFSDVTMNGGGEKVSLFSDVSSGIAGGKIPEKTLAEFSKIYGGVHISAGSAEGSEQAKQTAKLASMFPLIKESLKKPGQLPVKGGDKTANGGSNEARILNALNNAKSWQDFDCKSTDEVSSLSTAEEAFEKQQKKKTRKTVTCIQGPAFEQAYVSLHPFSLIQTPMFMNKIREICEEVEVDVVPEDVKTKLMDFLDDVAEKDELKKIALFNMILLSIKDGSDAVQAAANVMVHYHACIDGTSD